MPLYEYACACGAQAEDLFSMDEAPGSIPCPRCDGGELRKQMSLPSKTPGRWGDQTGKWGVNGFHDRGLGARYHNSMERDRIVRSRGLIPLEDMPKDWWETNTAKQLEEKERDEKLAHRLKTTAAQFGGDMARAVSEVMPAREILAGKYDKRGA
jgi:putative FmdB family regulatory protein